MPERYEFLYVLLKLYLWIETQIPNVNEDHEMSMPMFDPTHNVKTKT